MRSSALIPRRRVKTQGSLPTEDAALILLFSFVASGQIKLRKIDGHTTMATRRSTESGGSPSDFHIKRDTTVPLENGS